MNVTVTLNNKDSFSLAPGEKITSSLPQDHFNISLCAEKWLIQEKQILFACCACSANQDILGHNLLSPSGEEVGKVYVVSWREETIQLCQLTAQTISHNSKTYTVYICAKLIPHLSQQGLYRMD